VANTLKIIQIFFAAALTVVTSSCRDATTSAHVLSGNMSFTRGHYQKAILQYLEAEDDMSFGKDVVFYNLANVYYSLGEGDAALKTWSMAEENTDNVDVLFRIAFNRGVLYYNWGRFDEAYRSFRRALKLNPSDIDSKINLEDSLSRIRTTVPQNSTEAIDEKNRSSRHLLDYVQRKEADAWSGKVAAYEETEEDW